MNKFAKTFRLHLSISERNTGNNELFLDKLEKTAEYLDYRKGDLNGQINISLMFIRLVEDRYKLIFGNNNPSNVEVNYTLIDFDSIRVKLRSFNNPRYSPQQKIRDMRKYYLASLTTIEKEFKKRIAELEYEISELKDDKQ